MVSRSELLDRLKGVCMIIIIVTIGCYTYPPILAFGIVGCCADEYFHILTRLFSSLRCSSDPSSSMWIPSVHHRLTFISACVTISIAAIAGERALIAATMVWSIVTIGYTMFRQREQPTCTTTTTEQQQQQQQQSRTIIESEASTHLHPPTATSLYLSSSPVTSAHHVLFVLLPVFGLWYCAFLFSHAILILMHPSNTEKNIGLRRIIYTIFTTAGGENGGMVIGAWFGRTKLIPHISPNKTRQGAVGQIVMSIIVSIMFASYIDIEFGMFESLILGVILGLNGILGDLFESFFKRSVGLKDAGKIIPGAGGMLDRMDGLIFNLPTLWYWINIIHDNL